MSTVKEVEADIRKVAKTMRSNIQKALFFEATLIKKDIQDRSPVDSGFFRKNWTISRNRFQSGNEFTGVSISNQTSYAFYMEFGAPEGGKPWYYPNPKRKRTGKLIRRNGRVWAGGLNPGHTKTVGGAIGPIIAENEPRLRKLTNIIADSILGGIK